MIRSPVPYLIAIVLLFQISFSLAQEKDSAPSPVPKVVKLNAGGKEYLRLLGGPPETSTIRSGLVTLGPKKSVGKHNTEAYEEMVIVLRGKGMMKISGGNDLPFKKGEIVYCPSHTEHDVMNTGSGILQYIYIVAETKD